MQFRIANPRRKRRSRIKGVRKALRTRRMRRRFCSTAGRSLARCRVHPFRIRRRRRHVRAYRKHHRRVRHHRLPPRGVKGRFISRHTRRARRSRRHLISVTRKHGRTVYRYKNPTLMIGNPRRHRRSRRGFRRHHIVYTKNPPARLKDIISRDMLTTVLSLTGGFYSATLVRNQVGAMLVPANASRTTEFVINLAAKVGTGLLGGLLLRRWNQRIAAGFVVGATVNAAWDLIAFLTGYEVSIREYVTPITTARRLRLGCVGAGCAAYSPALRAYSPAFGKAWGRAF